MIRLALFTVTVAAVLFAFLAIAPAQQIRYIIPPVEYDRPYEGDLTILTYDSTERIKLACNMPSSLPSLACAFPGKGSCWIIIATPELAASLGWDWDVIHRHEIAHCNGWPASHPGARPWVQYERRTSRK